MHHKTVIFALLLVLLVGTAMAQWVPDGAAVCTATGSQADLEVVSDGAGGAIITWEDNRSGSNDIYIQRVNALGVAQWAAGGVCICSATGNQENPEIIPDGYGGAIIVWMDGRSGIMWDIYAQRVNSSGVVQWTANGVAVCTAADAQFAPVMVSDGSGGAIIAWYDLRLGTDMNIFAQRVNASGAVQWTADGVSVCNQAGDQTSTSITSDGSGGAIIAWQDYRSGNDDIYVQRVLGQAGGRVWTSNGVAVCTATNHQTFPRIVSDGSGGAIITWQDNRSSNYDIYAQRVDASGVAQWTADGVGVCTATGNQFFSSSIQDGSGGAIIGWHDIRSGNNDIYVQRINGSGASLWTGNGLAICTATYSQEYPHLCLDGAGGAIIAWSDNRGMNWNIYAQRLNPAGSALWAANGEAVSAAANAQQNPVLATDGVGGAIVAWTDSRGADQDVYASRLDKHDGSYWGRNAPAVTDIRDVPNDQGGTVNLSWTPSYLDAWPDTLVSHYTVWRSLTGAKHGLPQVDPSRVDAGFQGPGFLLDAKGYAWQWLATIPWQAYLPGYSYPAPTLCDSGPSGKVHHHYMVIAHTDNPVLYWNSAPDSGYSVDNLPPSKALLLVGQLAKGPKADIRLDWNRETVADLWRYGVYRDVSSGFTPGPGNFICYSDDTTETDAPTEACWYKVTAFDVHGNEGAPSNEWYYDGSLSAQLSMFAAMELDDGRVSVRWRTESEENCLRWEVERSDAPGSTYLALGSVPGQGSTAQPTDYRYDDESELAPRTYYYRLGQVDLDGGKRYFGPVSLSYQWRVPAEAGIAGARPNPFSQITTINYQITTSGPVSLKVYNVYGQLVRTLETGQKPAGYHRARWDGRNDIGQAVSAGVYLVRLEGSGVASSSARVAVVR